MKISVIPAIILFCVLLEDLELFKAFTLELFASVGCCASKLLSSSLKPLCRVVAVQQVAVYINANYDCDVKQVTILNHHEFHRLFCQLDH